MKRILLVLFAGLTTYFGFGQALINYEFQIVEFRQHSCADGPGDDNETTWKLWYRDNTMGGSWQFGNCHFSDDGLPNILQPTSNNYAQHLVTTATSLDIRIDFWEDDCDGGTGSDRCTFNTCFFGTQSDDDRENHNPFIGSGGNYPAINMRDSSYCEWHTCSYNIGCYSFKFKFKWEYSSIDAGPTSMIGCNDSVQLAGSGSGEWSILSGGTGGFLDNEDPNTIFYGNTGGNYTLQFSALTSCTSATTIGNSTVDVAMVASIVPDLQLTNSPCEGTQQDFDVADGGTYYWAVGNPTNYVDTTTLNDFSFTPSGNNVDLYVTVESPQGCLSYDSLNYTLIQAPVVDLGNDTTICPGTFIAVNATNQNTGLTQYLWSNGEQSSVAQLSTPGIYFCTLTNLDYCTNSDTIEIFNYPVSPLDLGADVEFCLGDTVTLDAGAQFNFDSYLWSDNSTGSMLQVANFGTYYVDAVDANNCTFTDSVVFSPEYVYFSLYEDTTIYLGMTIDLEAESGVSYLWNVGDTSRIITVTPQNDTTYEVTIEQTNGCYRVGTVNVFIDESIIIFIPNMFSPNNDGSNDQLLVYGNGIESINFKVFNRWGDMIFESGDVNEMQTIGWEGTSNGVDQPTGTYVWTLEGIDTFGNPIHFNNQNTGTVLLRR